MLPLTKSEQTNSKNTHYYQDSKNNYYTVTIQNNGVVDVDIRNNFLQGQNYFLIHKIFLSSMEAERFFKRLYNARVLEG